MNLREAAQQALEALGLMLVDGNSTDDNYRASIQKQAQKAIFSLRDALSQTPPKREWERAMELVQEYEQLRDEK